MQSKTTVYFSLFMLTLLIIAVLAGCKWNNMDNNTTQLNKSFRDFSQAIEQEMSNGLHLNIYYIDPSILTRYPLSVDELIHSSLVQTIVIDSVHLKENIELLKQLNADGLIPAKSKSKLNARLCYIFETDNNEKILEVAIGGDNNSIFVNGVEVERDYRFRNVIEPFVSEEEMSDLEYIFEGTVKITD